MISPITVTTRPSTTASNKSDSGIIFLRKNIITSSRMPTPAGDPGVIRPASQAIIYVAPIYI